MILKEAPPTRRNKVPDSTKSEKQQAEALQREAEATQKANQYRAEQQTGRTMLSRFKAATRNCRDKKTTYFSVSVRRKNRDQCTAEVRQQDSSPLSESASIAAAASPESLEGRSSRKRPGQEAIGESAAEGLKCDASSHRFHLPR